jgi:flagellar hook protein FlgE
MFAAISGLKNHQVMLDVTANDIANVNTIGYKSARTTFKDSLNQLQRGASGPGGGAGGANAAQVGLGVTLGSIDNLMQGGSLQSTGNVFDVAITGPGFFRVSTSTATRPTPARTSSTPRRQLHHQQRRLPAHAGRLLRPGPGRRRRRPADPGPGRLDQRRHRPERRGHLRRRHGHARLGGLPLAGDVPELGRPRALRLQPLARVGQLRPATIGQPGPQFGFTTSGVVEMSNVDLAQTFTQMITAQRGFQANSRVISTSDEMLQDLVNLKR